MAANKFATMIHRNTNKITFLLIYAVLEWALILLLLLNSLFSFLIIKFSQLFALKSSCFWCSTLHQFFEPQNVNLHRDLLCEFHSKEVSKLGFCPNHKKLAEIKDLCDDCFSCHLDFQSEVKRSDGEDEDEQNLKCSCCGLKVQKSSVDHKHNVLEFSRKRDLVMGIENEIGSALMEESSKIQMKSCETGIWLNQFEERGDSTSDFLPQHLEFFFDFSGNQLVPIELVDSTTEESQNISEADQDHEFGDYQMAHMIQEHDTPGLESMELEETQNSLVFHAKSAVADETPPPFVDTEELQETVIETKKLDPRTHLGLESKNLNRKESRAEESLDGSLMSEMEGGDPINTTEKVKSALHALKAELEEERSASAIAASETMAMITRLQEEKAAMQMEALQYQRMMEEQSEYDQEALQLLNELMIKKEKELEMYRKKVADYEAKERMQFSQGCLNSTSASSSHSENGNGMAIETTTHEWNENQENGVLELESSLMDFEEERLSIFEQIKVIEEKLFTLSDEEDQYFADVRPIEDLLEENGFNSNDMVTKSNGFHSNDTVTNSNGCHSNEIKRMDIAVEVDQVYERLHALEADREFLKHCIGSLNKGEKGMELLQEILQHLRDLRTMDFQA